MYIYHALINALSAHMIHINLNMIFYTHVEHSPTKTIYVKYRRRKKEEKKALQTHTHNVCKALLLIVLYPHVCVFLCAIPSTPHLPKETVLGFAFHCMLNHNLQRSFPFFLQAEFEWQI